MDRVYREIARDAARASGAALAHLVLVRCLEAAEPAAHPAGGDTPVALATRYVARGGGADGPVLAERLARQAIQAALAADPVPLAAHPVLGGDEERVVAPAPPALASLLAPLLARGDGQPHSVYLPVGDVAQPAILHLAFAGPPRPSALAALESVGRLTAGRLAAVSLRQEATRDRIVLADLLQAKETLAGLQIAGTHLMIETDEGSILGAVSRELARLGLHSGVLLDTPGADADRPVLHWRFTSLPSTQQRAMERILGRPLSALRIDPATAPLVRHCLEEGRTLVTDRPRALARDLLDGASAPQLRALGRLLGLLRIVLAPLRREGRTIGLLAVLAPRLRPGDPEAIEAFALQASIALEKARLVAALREERARLEGEVERRTRELRLAVETLQETDRRKDSFLANVSHELRTPLVTVLGWADLLAAEKLGPLEGRQRQAAQVIRASGRRLETFITELLDFSRHELTRDRLQLGAFEAGEVLSQAVVGLAPRFAERGLRVRARAAGGLPRLWADRDRVVQVLVNLLTNADRHSSAGGTILVAAARGRAGAVVVSVTDQGEGIAPEHLARIFDRLYQVRDAAAPRDRGGGLGLGLAIARSIVEAHGGTITVRSRVGRGTSFRFSLPTVEVLADR
jgi:signal transduction histidine kinase